MSNYPDKLRDPRRQRKRLEIFNRDERRCVVCDDGEQELQVHHVAYEGKRNPWEVADHNMATLCRTCHATISVSFEQLKEDYGWDERTAKEGRRWIDRNLTQWHRKLKGETTESPPPLPREYRTRESNRTPSDRQTRRPPDNRPGRADHPPRFEEQERPERKSDFEKAVRIVAMTIMAVILFGVGVFLATR